MLLTILAFIALLLIYCAVLRARTADDTAEQVERAVAEGNGLHRSLLDGAREIVRSTGHWPHIVVTRACKPNCTCHGDNLNQGD